MDEVPPLPDDLTDEEHRKALLPPFMRRRLANGIDPILAAKSERLAEIRADDRAVPLDELVAARNRALREMVRRIPQMKPQEVISAVELLDGEIASQRVGHADSPEKAKATREEMLQRLQGDKPKEVQEQVKADPLRR